MFPPLTDRAERPPSSQMTLSQLGGADMSSTAARSSVSSEYPVSVGCETVRNKIMVLLSYSSSRNCCKRNVLLLSTASFSYFSVLYISNKVKNLTENFFFPTKIYINFFVFHPKRFLDRCLCIFFMY